MNMHSETWPDGTPKSLHTVFNWISPESRAQKVDAPLTRLELNRKRQRAYEFKKYHAKKAGANNATDN